MADSEVVSLLRSLMRFDTTNPPGNETPCARFLADVFEKEGVAAEVVESAPGRGNVVPRLKGGSEPPLLLCAHLDVVPATGKWTHPPFEARLQGGYIWGRGAIDMKHMAAMSACVMALLANGCAG
jgi:acetylornithine deacetylase/succinyl-diaminopimelate desuccinylase-like protein